MSDQWDFYMKKMADRPSSLFIDVGIAQEAPKEWYSVRLSVSVKQKNTRPDGLTSQEEADRLWDLEDALVPQVKEWGAIFVGRITTDGRRDFIFYAKSEGEFDRLVSKAIKPFGYEFETGAEKDAGWSFYFDVLYPTPRDWQRIMNRHVLENLRRGGDDLSKPRRIFHWLYFSKEADRDRSAETARNMGFGIRIPPKSDNPNKRFPLALRLYRIDSVAPQAIDELTQELFSLAQANSGRYDGWETQIVKAGDEPTEDLPPD